MRTYYTHRILAAITALLISLSASAQLNEFHFTALPLFDQSSRNTYVYAIPPDSVFGLIYKQPVLDPAVSWMQRPAYIVPCGSKDSLMRDETLPPGHYLTVSARQNRMELHFREKPAFRTQIADIERIRILSFFDMAGRELRNITVRLNQQLIPYDAGMGGHVVQHFSDGDIIRMQLGNYVQYHKCHVAKNYEYEGSRPRNESREHDRINRLYSGYLVTNKPVYLPGDTVKWKAYLEDPRDKNRLVREGLRIGFSDQRGGPYYRIAAKYRPEEAGVYFGEFVLGDSVKPDKVYYLELYGTQTAERIEQAFKVEDYLLEETKLRVSGDSLPLYQAGDSVNLWAAAYNSNNLPVLDGQLSITVVPVDYNMAPVQQVFIPDTLYSASVGVRSEGETNIGFSTKEFPAALRSFRCFVSLVNSNFVRADTSFLLRFTDEDQYIRITEEGNSVRAELIRQKMPVKGSGRLVVHNGKSLALAPMLISFPFTYRIQEDAHSLHFSRLDSRAPVQVHHIGEASILGYEQFDGDTASIELVNPKGVHFRYALYTGEEFAGYGYMRGDTVIRVYSPKGKTVSLIGAYTWKGQVRQQRFDIFKMDRSLKIDLRKKDLVYPGQKDTIRIRLSNTDGKAIPATNVTVLAFNSQFVEDYTPALPYGGYLWPAYSSRKIRRIDQMGMFQPVSEAATRSWLSRCGADTQFFYKNLYLLPHDIAWVLYDIPASKQPQLGIFVKKGSEFYHPEIIYIDDRPVYAHVASSVNPAGFFVPEGTHHLRFRLGDGEYSMRALDICAGMKTDLYINIDSVGPFYHMVKRNDTVKTVQRANSISNVVAKYNMSDTLTAHELVTLAYSLLLYQPEYSLSMPGGNRIYTGEPQFFQGLRQLGGSGGAHYNNYQSPVQLVGPFNLSDSIGFFQANNTKLRFAPEVGQIFSFRPGMTRVERVESSRYIRKRLDWHNVWPAPHFVAPDPADYDALEVMPKPVETVLPANKPGAPAPAIPTRKRGGKFPVQDSAAFIPAYQLLPTPSYPADSLATARLRIARLDSAIRYVVFRRVQREGYGGRRQKADSNTVYVSGNVHSVVALIPGTYEVMIFWTNKHYSVLRSVQPKPGGVTVLPVRYSPDEGLFNPIEAPLWLAPHMADHTGQAIWPRVVQYQPQEPVTYSHGHSGIKGTLTDEKGNPVVNGYVEVSEGGIVKGRELTDFDGKFHVRSLGSGRFQVKFSYQGKEMIYTDVILAADQLVTVNGKLYTATQLSEVVTRAYRYQAPIINMASPGGRSVRTAEVIEKSATRNASDIASLSTQVYQGGYAGGLNIGGGRGAGTRYTVDGVQLNQGGSQFRNAAPEGGDFRDDLTGRGPGSGLLNRRSDEAQAFFSNFMANMSGASGMRRSFRDWAIWEPNLWTDDHGETSFTASYPDNLTSWKTYVLAMNRDGYTGRVLKLTRAFKPLSAQITAPRFLRYGDSAEALAKVANYTQQAFRLRSAFSSNGARIAADTMTVHNTRVQVLHVAAPASNSIDSFDLPVSYSITADNGYTDGEERILPVYPVGVTESKGEFVYLYNDTAISSRPDPGAGHFTGRTRVHVDGSLLEVMLREVEQLKTDPHGCNEQMTTKLLAIYYEEAIKKLLGRKDFNNTVTKKKILEKLVRAQHTDGGFGWWHANGADDRITNYIISTMQKVNSDGWLDYIIRRGMSYLNRHMEQMSPAYRITALQTLSAGNYPANYKGLINELDSQKHLSVYDRMALVRIRKEQGLPYRAALDSLMKRRIETVHGTHWGERSYDWYRDDLATTLLAYSVIKGDSVYGHMIPSVTKYILFQRQNGYYRNTASSGLVLTTIMPELLGRQTIGSSRKATYVKVSGSVKDSVTAFPKTYMLTDQQPALTFEKRGISPVYVSVVYDYFNTRPEPRDSTFAVRTEFTDGRQSLTKLRTGQRVTLRVTVTCKKEVEYVMIEVPIPAGCIQTDKRTGSSGIEAAREHFRDQTDIFCNRLSQGTYTFDIPLEARFSGSYNISPARAGMMYYPEEYGHTGVSRVRISPAGQGGSAHSVHAE